MIRVAPNATKMNEKAIERQERWRGKVLLLFCFVGILFVAFKLIFLFIFIFSGDRGRLYKGERCGTGVYDVKFPHNQ